MLEKSFIEKVKVGLYVISALVLIGTGVRYIPAIKFNSNFNSNIIRSSFWNAALKTPLTTLQTKHADAATLNVQTWWPADGAHVQGIQPFKGILENMTPDQYTMYWKVDDGALVSMDTNNTDYPHKEANVDISSWSWKGQGPYKITFVAKDNSGQYLAEKSVTIYNSGISTTAVSPSVVTTPPVVQPAITPVITQPVIAAVTSTIIPVNVWWPADNATVTGNQPFKAVVDNKNVNDYSMSWQVDGGSLNPMVTNNTDFPHKEALVGLDGWTWKGAGPYVITYVAKDNSGTIIAQKNITLYTGPHSGTGTPTAPANTQQTTQNPAPTITASSNNPLSSFKLYVDSNSPAAQDANTMRSWNSYNASLLDKIANAPQAIWLGGWSGDVTTAVKNGIQAANAKGATATFVAYNIPARDCGSYSAGGQNSPEGYRSWIQGLKNGIGSNKAIVILEPDALPGITCLSSADQTTRYALLKDAVATLKNNSNAIVYIDAGNSHWIAVNDMATRLQKAGIDQADGFSLNVSNYYPTSDATSYGTTLSKLVGNKHFVIDTSRNGSGDNGQWCNPSGRSLGNKPTTSTGNPLIDAYLWIKHPGESDGSCSGGPSAGQWWTDYALGLAQRAAY